MFFESGGGRPSDTDIPLVSALDVTTFAAWARVSGRVPRITVVDDNCFAGKAVIAGCADLIVATPRASLGMGGPEMIAEARHLLGYFFGPVDDWTASDQAPLREAVPESERTAYNVLPIIETLCDDDSLTVLQPGFAPELVTALGRIEGRTVGLIANDTCHTARAITADAEQTGLVRHTSRLLVAAARMRAPLVGVVLGRAYGLGAQAMLGGSTHEPLMTVGWPGAHLGAMGLEGAVRLTMCKELEAIDDVDERGRQVRELTAHAQANASALNVARLFEIDDAIGPTARDGRLTGSGATVDTW